MSSPRNAARRLALLVLALLPACSLPYRPLPESGPLRRPVSLLVENRGFEDVAVYAQTGSIRQRVGTAPGLQTTRLALPRGVEGTVRLGADPIGAYRAYGTDALRVRPGDRVEWTIETNPGLSMWFVRAPGLR